MSLVSNRPGFGFSTGFAVSNSHSHSCGAKSTGKDANPLEDLLIKTGRGGAMLNPSKKESLEKVAEFMDKHPEVFGKPHGRDTWLSELKEDNFLNGREANKFSGAIDMMKDALGAEGAQGGGGAQASGGTPGGAAQSQNTQGQGGGAGQNFDNALIPSGNGESYLNPSKKNELESVAKFMDQHPEAFGKPDGRDTWLSELKENNHLDKGETKNFSNAIDMLKDAQGAFGGGQTGEANGAGSNFNAGQTQPQSQSQSQGQGGGLDLKNTLVETGKGDAYLNPTKKNELEAVAKYMDQHPEVFGKPDGKESWLSELKEDNYLDKNETKGFKKAMDMMQDAGVGQGGGATQGAGQTNGAPGNVTGGQGTGQSQAPSQSQGQGQGGGLDLKDALVQTGKGDAFLNPSKKAELESVAKYMDQHPEVFGKPDGKESWLSELKEDNYLDKNENKAFSSAIDMMQDARAAGGANQSGETAQANGAGQSNGQATGASDTPPTSTQQTQGQAQGNKPNLDDVLVQTGKGDAFFNPSKKAEMESVAKFMDQHPDKFGKPDGKESWLSELKEDNYLSGSENKVFSKAIDMMKDAQTA